MGDHAAVEEPLIAVLSGRVSYKRVVDFVQWTWASAKLTPEEWFDGIRDHKLAYEPHPGVIGTVQWQGEMTCGDNPFVWARLVRNARVEASGDERRSNGCKPVGYEPDECDSDGCGGVEAKSHYACPWWV